MEFIFDADYAHAKKVCIDLKIKSSGNNHDLYFQSDTLLLADVFENFQNMCSKIYDLDPANFISASGLAWQSALKKAKIKITSFNWYSYVTNGRKRYQGWNMSHYFSTCDSR